MAVKAKLRVVLHADKVLVAESDDAALWQRVFSAISTGNLNLLATEGIEGGAGEKGDLGAVGHKGTGKGISAFAGEIGITVSEAEGAFGPSNEAPFIQLDPHLWEALKKNTPQRGSNAVPPIALAATALAIWFRHSDIDGSPTVKQCQDVLKTIDLRDQNAARSLRNTEWLQARGNGIVINPAQRSRAIKLMLAYCRKTSIDGNG